MSIASRQVLLKDAEKAFGSVLTVEQMQKIMPMLGEALAGFDVEQVTDADASGGDLLCAFVEAKEIEGRSKKTLERYQYIIRQFLKASGTVTQKVTVYHIRSFLMAEKRRGLSDRTLEGYRCVFSSFFGWLQKEGLIPANPCANLGAIKCAKVVREPYSATDIERLKEACSSLRDRAIIMFLLSSGCRISEVCGLNRNDIDMASAECTVLGKGNKERVVYLDSVALMLLRRYLDERRGPCALDPGQRPGQSRPTGASCQSRKDAHNALFVGLRGERLQPGGVRAMLKQLEAKTGVPNVHPHRFRRTLATNLIARGMPIQEVAAILGHDKLDTTMKYVYLEKSSIKNSFAKYA